MRDTVRCRIIIATLLLGIAGASGWATAQVPYGNADRGEAIYKALCLRCHGTFGEGDGPDAKDLIVQPENFQSLTSRDRGDFELLVSLSNGVLFSPMHAWRGRLTEQEMMDVIRYIRALAPPHPIS